MVHDGKEEDADEKSCESGAFKKVFRSFLYKCTGIQDIRDTGYGIGNLDSLIFI